MADPNLAEQLKATVNDVRQRAAAAEASRLQQEEFDRNEAKRQEEAAREAKRQQEEADRVAKQQRDETARLAKLQQEEAARNAARQLEDRTRHVQARVAENVAKTMEGLKLLQQTLDEDNQFKFEQLSDSDLNHRALLTVYF
jgi:hypothetical protein